VVLVQDGPHAGKIAAIAEIIDHNRVCASQLTSVIVPIPTIRRLSLTDHRLVSPDKPSRSAILSLHR
jgi:ribosomal protein L14E/L6E/L27E